MTNEQIVRNAVDCFPDPARRESYFDLYTENVVIHGYAGLEPGLDNVKAFYRHMIWSAFPDARVNILDLLSQGDKLALRFTLTGTHQGSFQGIAPTGRTIELKGITILRFENGKCVERWAIADFPDLMAQLTA